MDTIRNKEEIKERLTKSIAWYDDRIKAWENVKRLTKKDGNNFASFNKNFDGASTGKYYPVEDWAHPYLTVGFYSTCEGYTHDEISLTIDNYEKKIVPEHNPDREVRRTHWGTDNEIATIDEVFLLINATIENYKEHKERNESELKKLDSIFKKIEKEVEKINSIINETNDGYYHSTLGYALSDYVKTMVR